jgi:hypothetical protein
MEHREERESVAIQEHREAVHIATTQEKEARSVYFCQPISLPSHFLGFGTSGGTMRASGMVSLPVIMSAC